jgi:hypothetical protein
VKVLGSYMVWSYLFNFLTSALAIFLSVGLLFECKAASTSSFISSRSLNSEILFEGGGFLCPPKHIFDAGAFDKCTYRTSTSTTMQAGVPLGVLESFVHVSSALFINEMMLGNFSGHKIGIWSVTKKDNLR